MKCEMYDCKNEGIIKAKWFDGTILTVCLPCFKYHKKHDVIIGYYSTLEKTKKGANMFSVKQKREIADKVQRILRETNHPELPKGEISFNLHVNGAGDWSWADIRNNKSINPHNELMDTSCPGFECKTDLRPFTLHVPGCPKCR